MRAIMKGIVDEEVGGNYLYHATSAGGLKSILQSGVVQAATGPQLATRAQTKMPTVSVTRDWGYASGSNATQQMGGIGRDAILVFDRSRVENNFKTLGTSQSSEVRGLAYNPNFGGKEQNQSLQARTIAKKKYDYAQQSDPETKASYNTPKAGGEFEEAVVVPKGGLPIKGTLVGFWVNPESSLTKDPEIMNNPFRLDKTGPNKFVKAAQSQPVNEEELDENLRKWFKEKWVRFGPDGKIRGACARGDDSEGKPKCLPQKKAQNLGKKGRKYAASKKRREDPNPERTGKAKNVATKKKTNEGVPFNECPKCRGPIVHESMMNEKQDACYHKVKSRYKVWPSAYASGALVQCRKKGASNWGNSKKNENNVMKGIVDEGTNFVPHNILTEGKVLLEGRVVRKLWESAGQKIVEAQLTPQQIQQIFQAAEQGQTTAGGNRTFAGKGVDAASAVNRAWEDLKTKIQNTGPIQNMDAMYDKAAEAMKKSTGGDQGAMQYVQKYRAFAKKHPIAQSFLYAALIAAAGLSGAGAGGAAALGLLKMTDKLLQGDKFSSALYKGGVTGGLAYGATKIGDLLRPEQAGFKGGGGDFGGGGASGSWDYDPTSPKDAPKPIFVGNETIVIHSPSGGDLTVKAGDTLSEIAQRNNVSVQELLDANKDILNPDRLAVGQNVKIPGASGLGPYDQGVGTASDTYAKMQTGQYAQDPISYRQAAKTGVTESGATLSRLQVFSIMEAAILHQAILNEGIMSSIKGAAGKAAQWAKTKGHNVTTKITADKLMQAWKKAGSPTDSEQVKAVLKAAGVADQVIASVMPAQASIAGTSPTATTGTVQSKMKATTQPTVPAKPQAPAAPAQAAQPASAIGQGIAQSPQSNVNPELYNRLAARKAGKPVYAGGLEEDKAKPYVKPFIENGKQVGWKSSDGYHVKYWQMFAKDSAIKHAKLNPDEVQEDYTGEFAAEKTPAINPYGGLKDNKFRGAISEEPTNNPTGASGEGGLRKYKPKPAGEIEEDTSYAGGMGQGGNAGQSYRKFKPKSAGTFKEDELDEACWKGYHKEGNKKMFGKTYPNCVKNTNEEEQLDEKCWDSHKQVGMKNKGGKSVPNCVPKESAIMKGIKNRLI